MPLDPLQPGIPNAAGQPGSPRPVPVRAPVPVSVQGSNPQQGSNPAASPTPVPISARPIPVKNKTGDPIYVAEKKEISDDDFDAPKVLLKKSRPFMLSFGVHIGFLIIVALTITQVVVQQSTDSVEVVSQRNIDQPLDELSDQLGEQLIKENPNPADIKDITQPQLDGDAGGAGTLDLPTIGDDFISKFPDPIVSTNLAPPGDFGPPVGKGGGFTLGRAGGTKRGLLGRFGGTPETEDSVKKALTWLQKNQLPNGTWSLVKPYTNPGQVENPVSATAMALLAFQGYGDTHVNGEFKDCVDKGWKALLKMQNNDGFFRDDGMQHSVTHAMYSHGQVTIAICEIYGMTHDEVFKGPAQKAINYCLQLQDPINGGWRYANGGDSDTSVTGWILMGLMSGKMAGLNVPQASFDRISKFLDKVQFENGSRYFYNLNERTESNAMTAEGLLMRQYLGWKRDDDRLAKGVKFILGKSLNQKEQDVYYWYYATQVCHHMEGDAWDSWNTTMRKILPETQVTSGDEEGSWNPGSDRWGKEMGRLYITCLSTYMLEVYYRHLPIYDKLYKKDQ